LVDVHAFPLENGLWSAPTDKPVHYIHDSVLVALPVLFAKMFSKGFEDAKHLPFVVTSGKKFVGISD